MARKKRIVKPSLNLPKKEEGQNRRFRLTEEEEKHLLDFRKQKIALLSTCEEAGIEMKDVKHYWYKSKHFSVFAKNKVSSYEEIRDELIESMDKHSPKYPKIKRKTLKDPHLLVIDPADIHIGKFCSDLETGKYDMDIAVQRVREGVQGILDKSKGFDIEKIMLVAGNDVLHIDTPSRTTTGGTPQDTDGNWYENFQVAKELYVHIVEMLLPIAPVHFTFNPSNHDFMSGFFLADVIKSWFRNCKDVEFDCSIKHRKYLMYYDNLIGTTHGDGAKNQDLPLLMATECPYWSDTKFRYVYTHHVHHKMAKDYIGVTVESLRSPSGTDSWHDRKGYLSKKAIEGFLHHRNQGQVARITHYF